MPAFRKRSWGRVVSLRRMVGAVTVLAAAGMLLAMTASFGGPDEHLAARQDVAATPEASPVASPIASIFLPGTPVDHILAVVGTAPTPPGAEVTWSTYENSIMGLSLQFPSSWTYQESDDRLRVVFYPPGSDPAVPSPLIAFGLAPARPFDPAAVAPIGSTDPAPVTVAGVDGRRYEDSSLAVPYQSATIELPHRGGTLVITATLGPTINLVPILEQILPALLLYP